MNNTETIQLSKVREFTKEDWYANNGVTRFGDRRYLPGEIHPNLTAPLIASDDDRFVLIGDSLGLFVEFYHEDVVVVSEDGEETTEVIEEVFYLDREGQSQAQARVEMEKLLSGGFEAFGQTVRTTFETN